MCVIISIYNEAENESRKSLLADNLKSFSKQNDDGTAHFGFNANHPEKVRYVRDLKNETQEGFENILSRYNVNHFHFRSATKSKVSESNVHFWKYKNWVFAHNGIVSNFENEKTADSLILFRKLISENCFSGKHNINIQKITKIISTLSFWGRLIIINTDSKSAYYFGDYNLYLIDKKIMVISSTELNQSEVKFYGRGFENDSMSENIIHEKIDGIFKINPLKKHFKEYDVDFSPSYKSRYYGAGGMKFSQPVYNYSDEYPDLWPELPGAPVEQSAKKVEPVEELESRKSAEVNLSDKPLWKIL